MWIWESAIAYCFNVSIYSDYVNFFASLGQEKYFPGITLEWIHQHFNSTYIHWQGDHGYSGGPWPDDDWAFDGYGECVYK